MSDDSRAKRVCYLFYGGFIITILVLMTPLIPGVYMFETDFVNLNNLSIGNIQGVDRILVSFASFSLVTMTNFFLHHASSGVTGMDNCSGYLVILN